MSHFNYLENDIGYDRNCDIDVKLDKFQMICEKINRVFRNKVRRDTKLKFYKIMAVLYCLMGVNYRQQPKTRQNINTMNKQQSSDNRVVVKKL